MKNRVLIIRLSALGDVAMTVPAIRAYAIEHPEYEVTVLTKRFFSRLFINCPENIRFIYFTDEHRTTTGLMRLIKQLHQQHFSMVFDLHDVLRSWIICASFAVRGVKVVRMHKDRAERRRVLQHKQQQAMPFVQRYQDVLGVEVKHCASLQEAKEQPRPRIGLAPTARYTNKTYPLSLMKEVARLLAEAGAEVLIFGAKSEREEFLKWQQLHPQIHCVAGTMQIEEELNLMSQLDVMVSMDSANQHLASLVGTRVVSVWGSTTPACGFMGWGQSADDAVCLNLPCQPCTIAGSKSCPLGHMNCLNDISPTTIVERVMNT